jgi:tetratricopeptide (TPR) repeat protein
MKLPLERRVPAVNVARVAAVKELRGEELQVAVKGLLAKGLGAEELLAAARDLLGRGLKEKAAKQCVAQLAEKVLEAQPESAEAHVIRARALMEHDPKTAMKHLEAAVKGDAGASGLDACLRELVTRAQHLVGCGRKRQAAEAAATYLAVAKLHPAPDPGEMVAAHLARGRALVGVDDAAAVHHMEEALRASPQIDTVDPELAEAYFRLGKRRSQQNKRRAGEKYLRLAVQRYGAVAARSDRSPVGHYNLGQALVYLSRIETDPAPSRKRAVRSFQRALARARHRPNVFANSCYWLATLKEQDKEFPAATIYWEAAARVYGPTSPMGKQAVARANRVRGRR